MPTSTIISNYFDNLDENDKKHYLTKLSLTDGTQFPDPWENNAGWSNDLTQLPDITFGDIYTYLIDTPSIFTGEKLKAFKSLEAYKYYLAGHVQDVLIKKIPTTDYVTLKTEVRYLFTIAIGNTIINHSKKIYTPYKIYKYFV